MLEYFVLSGQILVSNLHICTLHRTKGSSDSYHQDRHPLDANWKVSPLLMGHAESIGKMWAGQTSSSNAQHHDHFFLPAVAEMCARVAAEPSATAGGGAASMTLLHQGHQRQLLPALELNVQHGRAFRCDCRLQVPFTVPGKASMDAQQRQACYSAHHLPAIKSVKL